MKRRQIKEIAYLSFVGVILVIAQACKCQCDEVDCISDINPFRFNFSKEDFSVAELESISIVRTDNSFNGIDTVDVHSYFNSTDFSIQYFNLGEIYSDDFEMKDFNYLLMINTINQVDTISSINYDFSMISKVCNPCSGGANCKDEYYDYKQYSNAGFKINGQEQTGFEIVIDKK